jgi:hypothetical protein
MDPVLVNFLATRFNDPNENGPITRENNAIATLGKVDWYASANNLFTARYNFAHSRQPNGTFDVEQWGRSANAIDEHVNIGLAKTADSLPPPVSFPWPWTNSVVTQHVGVVPGWDSEKPDQVSLVGRYTQEWGFPSEKGICLRQS